MNPPAPTPTVPPASDSGLVNFVLTKRQNAGTLMLVLSAVFLVATIWCAVKGFRSPPAKAADKPVAADPFNPEEPEPLKPANTLDPKRADYLPGGIAGLLGFLVTASAGVYLTVGLPKLTEAARRTDARVVVLAVGGLLGSVVILLGAWYFYAWSDSLLGWLDRGERKQARWVLIPIVMIVAGAGLILGAVQPARAEERNNLWLRRLVYGSNLGLTALLLFVCLVVVNVVIAMKAPNKLDTTESGFYSLNDTTKDFLGRMTQPVTAYAILPGSGVRMENDIRDLLTAFTDSGRGNFKVKFISASVNTGDLAELRAKYPSVELNEMGVLLTVGEDQKRHTFIRIEEFFDRESAPGQERGQRTFVGEAKLMRELVFLAEDKVKPKIYFTQSAGEYDIAGGPQVSAERSAARLKAFLEKNYLDVLPLKLEGADAKVPADATVVVILNPVKTFTPEAAAAIDKYLADPLPEGRRGKVILLADAAPVVATKGPPPTGLEAVMRKYNVEIGQKYVFSLSNDNNIQPYESVAVFTGDAVRGKNSIARTFRQFAILMTAPREVSVAAGGNPALTALPILETSAAGGSWVEDTIPTTGVAQSYTQAKNQGRLAKTRTLGVVVSEGGAGRLAVYGNAGMVSDAEAQGGQDSPLGFDLVGVTIDWLRDRPPVPAGIMSKTYKMYVMPNAKNIDSSRLMYLPLGLAVLTVLGLGLGVWVIRRK